MKFSIGFKIAGLCVVLVVVSVAITAWASYLWTLEGNRALLVELRQSDLTEDLREDEAQLQASLRLLRHDVQALAGETRMQRLLNPKLRLKEVEGLFTETRYRGFSAEAFKTGLGPREHYLELCVIQKENGSWTMPVCTWREASGEIQSSVEGRPLADEHLLSLVSAAGDQPAPGTRLSPLEAKREPGAGPDPVLVVRCLAPVYQTLQEPRQLLGFIGVKIHLSYLLNAGTRDASSGTETTHASKLRYLTDEHGQVLAVSKGNGPFRPPEEEAGPRQLQDAYPEVRPLFQEPAVEEAPINHRANVSRHAGYCLRANLWPDHPDRFIALAAVVPYDSMVQAQPPPLGLLVVVGALIATATGLAFWFSRVLTRPLKAMTRAAEGLARGRFDVSLPVANDSEVGVLAGAFRHMVEQVHKRGQELQESETRIRAILDNAAEGIIAVDDHGTVEAFNQAAERIFGYTAAEVKGRSLQPILSPDHLQAIGGDLEKYLHTGILGVLGTTTERVGLRKDGSTFAMEMSVSAVDLGTRRLFTTIVRDVTERKRVEAEVRQLNETLERRVQERTLALGKANDALELARDQAMGANRAKSAFLAQMSHELRTPLNAIIGYSELLQEEAEATGQADFIPDLRKIVDAGRHLLTLINDILDLSKLEAGKMELCLESFEVAPLVAGVVSTIQPLVEKNGNTLEVHCPDPAGLMRADPTRVRQVLFNLLSNACKFTSQGKVVLEVERGPADGADWVTFRVRDTGRGIKPEEMKKIFQPFEQGDATTSRQYGGTGLGLSISRRLCQMMGGEVGFESEWGKGSTFTVRLPAEVRKRPAPAAAATPAAPAAPAPTGANPVLVVDDDLAVRDLLQRYLTKEGYQVLTASSGEEGLRLAKQLRPTAITLDVLMPGMDGWSVLTSLKADPETSDIPVIMLTITDNKNLGHALGASDYLTKPLDRARLAALLRKYQTQPTGQEILLVEDEADTRDLLRRTLEKGGWAVTEAVNGRDALEHVSRKAPSLILLDLMMPEMDGFEFLEEMRQKPEWRSIPVVVITSKDLSEEDRLRLSGSLLLSGCVKRVLQKGNYRREDLLDEVRELMAHHTDEPRGAPGPAA